MLASILYLFIKQRTAYDMRINYWSSDVCSSYLIAPDRCVPLVEEHGRARDLTVHVLEQALEDAFRWSEEGHPIGVAVNVSATLLRDHEFIELVGQILARRDRKSTRLNSSH